MPNSLPSSRRKRALELILRDGEAQVGVLAAQLGVSTITARRDIAALADEGLVERVHGGARRLEATGAHHGQYMTVGQFETGDSAPTDRAGATSRAPAPQKSMPRIAMVVPSLRYYWPSILRGATQAARELTADLAVQVSTSDAVANGAVVESLASDPSLDALIIAPEMRGCEATSRLMDRLGSLRIPVVIAERDVSGYGPAPYAFDAVRSDHSRGTAAAVRHLVGLGHSRVAMAADPYSPTRPHVEAGFDLSVAAFGLDREYAHQSILDTHGPGAFDEIDALLDRCAHLGTTGIVIHSDVAATLFLQHAERRGWSIPRDLSVVAYDDELSELTRPALTAVGPAKHELGARAVALALQRLRHPHAPIELVQLLPRLTIRETSAAPREGDPPRRAAAG